MVDIKSIVKPSDEELINYLQSNSDLSILMKKGGILHHTIQSKVGVGCTNLVREDYEILHSYLYPTECESYSYALNTYNSFKISDLTDSVSKFDDLCGCLKMNVMALKDIDAIFKFLNVGLPKVDFKWFEISADNIEDSLDYFIKNNVDNAIFIVK